MGDYSFDVKLFTRLLRPILGVEVADDHRVAGVVFPREFQLHLQSFNFRITIQCWSVRDECSHSRIRSRIALIDP